MLFKLIKLEALLLHQQQLCNKFIAFNNKLRTSKLDAQVFENNSLVLLVYVRTQRNVFGHCVTFFLFYYF